MTKMTERADVTVSWLRTSQGPPDTSRGSFFITASVMMLVAVFIGFSRTFYLRAYLRTPDITTGNELPWHLHLHGAVMSAWFVLVAVQALLIRSRRTLIHRRIGTIAIALAGMVICVGL